MKTGDSVTQPSGGDKPYSGVIVAANKHGEYLVRWHKGYSTWENETAISAREEGVR